MGRQRQDASSTTTEEVPLTRGSWRVRVWLGAGLGGACLLMVLLPLLRRSTGDAEGLAALAALAVLPLPVSILVSEVGIKRRWKPDLLFRGLPVWVAILMVLGAVWLGMQ